MSDNYGFIYIWFDRKHSRYYVGSHWGTEDDGYICSSFWMKRAHKTRPEDFRRRIVARIHTNRTDLLAEEHRWLTMIHEDELGKKYYNLCNHHFGHWTADNEKLKTVGQKISAKNKGKSLWGGKRPPEHGEAISRGKKGVPFTEEHKAAMRAARLVNPPIQHTDEWKKDAAKRSTGRWEDYRKNPITCSCGKVGCGPMMGRHVKNCDGISKQHRTRAQALKERWADPAWKEKQRERLREGSKRRWAHKIEKV